MKINIVVVACLFSFSIVSAEPPPVVISELMINPTVGKSKGTWFELYNPGNQPFDLSNRYLRLGNYNGSVVGFGVAGLQVTEIKIPTGSVIQPLQYLQPMAMFR
jgi:hypothetical protein